SSATVLNVLPTEPPRRAKPPIIRATMLIRMAYSTAVAPERERTKAEAVAMKPSAGPGDKTGLCRLGDRAGGDRIDRLRLRHRDVPGRDAAEEHDRDSGDRQRDRQERGKPRPRRTPGASGIDTH